MYVAQWSAKVLIDGTSMGADLFTVNKLALVQDMAGGAPVTVAWTPVTMIWSSMSSGSSAPTSVR